MPRDKTEFNLWNRLAGERRWWSAGSYETRRAAEAAGAGFRSKGAEVKITEDPVGRTHGLDSQKLDSAIEKAGYIVTERADAIAMPMSARGKAEWLAKQKQELADIERRKNDPRLGDQERAEELRRRLRETKADADSTPLKISVQRPVGYTIHAVGPGGKKTLEKSGTLSPKDVKADQVGTSGLMSDVIRDLKQTFGKAKPAETSPADPPVQSSQRLLPRVEYFPPQAPKRLGRGFFGRADGNDLEMMESELADLREQMKTAKTKTEKDDIRDSIRMIMQAIQNEKLDSVMAKADSIVKRA